MTDFLICADAQPDIGTGHIRRMLTLSKALQEQGADITLQTSPLGAEIARADRFDGEIACTPPSPSAVAQTLNIRHFDGVILDNYHWDATQEEKLRPYVDFIAVVDDLANRAHVSDLLLDQNAHQDTTAYDGLVPQHCTRLVGGAYCLLAKPFQQDRRPALEDRNAPVFVSLGGGDPHGDLLAVVDILLTATGLPLTIATGSHIRDAEGLRTLASKHAQRVELVFDSNHVADQMEKSQFAVAAGGTMTWERASMGLPSLCLVVADNQAASAQYLEKRGVHSVFDLRTPWPKGALARAVQHFAADLVRQRLYHDNSKRLVARDGAMRAARALLDSLQNSSSG